MRKVHYLILVLFGVMGCNPENNTEEVLPVAVYTTDLLTTIDENPGNNQLLGTVNATTNIGTVLFSVFSESLEGAFFIEPDTGKLRVADPSLFDYESTTLITGVIAVSNADITEYANVSVEILDVYLENERQLTNLEHMGSFNGPLFCDTRNAFEFNSANLVRWYTDYFDATLNDEFITEDEKITEYSLSFESPGNVYNETYTFTYNTFGLVSQIHYVRENPNIPSTEVYDFSITYNQLDGILVNDNTGETVQISFDIERFIRRVESNSRLLEYEYDLDNNLISKTDENGNMVTYIYDTKRNPFRDIASNNFSEIRGLINILKFDTSTDLLSSDRNNGIWQSSNNIIAIDAANCDGNCIESVAYSYTYNSDGYPSSKEIVGANNGSIQYIYQ